MSNKQFDGRKFKVDGKLVEEKIFDNADRLSKREITCDICDQWEEQDEIHSISEGETQEEKDNMEKYVCDVCNKCFGDLTDDEIIKTFKEKHNL